MNFSEHDNFQLILLTSVHVYVVQHKIKFKCTSQGQGVWVSKLSRGLWCQCPIWALAQAPVTPLQIQLPTNKPGKSRRHPEHLVPDTQMGDLDVGPALITAATIWGVNQQWKISSAHSDWLYIYIFF